MKSGFKGFLAGLVVGAVVAFPLGMNWSEPQVNLPVVGDQAIKEQVKKTKEQATRMGKEVIEQTREKIHKATEPEQQTKE